MKKGLIPFYRDLSEGNRGYTLFLDKQSNQVYKSYHKERNKNLYWLAFFPVLILLRGLKNVYLPLKHPAIITIFLLLTVISAIIGISIYIYYYKDLKKVYYTDTEILEYIEKGKKIFIKEIITIFVMLLFVILFTVLFIIYHWLIWLFFALFLFSVTILGLCGLPIGRFKLYKAKEER